ncbi:hypothetical protein LJR129_004970 [Acidovorax sp. LjRoot129]|uniref:hypothetical protein n=1 Tax=unclassified Acidovorax TaxID=2684926 RepID=UPI003ECEEB66
MSILNSALTFAAISFAVAVVMETADGASGAVDRVVERASTTLTATAQHALDVALTHLPPEQQAPQPTRVAAH